MFLSWSRPQAGAPVLKGQCRDGGARPAFCMALSLPLAVALPARARRIAGHPAMLEPLRATLHLSFCSAGGGRAGCAARCGRVGRFPAPRSAPAAPDRFALAMRRWPGPFAALGDWQGVIVGILHFCDVLPGLSGAGHSSLRSRAADADSTLLLPGSRASGQPFVSIRVSPSTSSWR